MQVKHLFTLLSEFTTTYEPPKIRNKPKIIIN